MVTQADKSRQIDLAAIKLTAIKSNTRHATAVVKSSQLDFTVLAAKPNCLDLAALVVKSNCVDIELRQPSLTSRYCGLGEQMNHLDIAAMVAVKPSRHYGFSGLVELSRPCGCGGQVKPSRHV